MNKHQDQARLAVESAVICALSAIVSSATAVSRSTTRNWRARRRSRRENEPNSKMLDKLEDVAIIKRRFELDTHYIGATKPIVEYMTSSSLESCG